MTRIIWFLREISSKLWLSVILYAAIAVATAFGAYFLQPFVPEQLYQFTGTDALGDILNILATSMLSVTIFSLSTMVTAYSSVTNSITPRATQLLLEDKVSHRALSTFLGAFIFSIVSIIILKTGVYGKEGRVILFMITIILVVIIVGTLLEWINYLTKLGRMNETMNRVEKRTTEALKNRLTNPYLGGNPLAGKGDIPSANIAKVTYNKVAYVLHIDMPYINDIAKEHGLKIYITALPGTFLSLNAVLAYVEGSDDEEILQKIAAGFITGQQRSFRQDPRYGIITLHEIASRALSPAINDPGTAIQVITRVVRILSLFAQRKEIEKTDISYENIYILPLTAKSFFQDFFIPVSRDGAASLEVGIMLQKAYEAFTLTGDEELTDLAKQYSELSFQYAKHAFPIEQDLQILQSRLIK